MTLDGPQRKGDLRRSRAAAVNIVPNSTGAVSYTHLDVYNRQSRSNRISWNFRSMEQYSKCKNAFK